MDRKSGEKEKLLITNYLYFVHSVFKQPLLYTHKNQGWERVIEQVLLLFSKYICVYMHFDVSHQLLYCIYDFSCQPFTTLWRLLMPPRIKPFKDKVTKGENAGNQHFILFPQCFLPFQKDIAPYELE